VRCTCISGGHDIYNYKKMVYLNVVWDTSLEIRTIIKNRYKHRKNLLEEVQLLKLLTVLRESMISKTGKTEGGSISTTCFRF
jgi:hypothetical protein